jgi:hypothetical protein
MNRRPWIVLGSLTGLVACPAIIGLTAILVRDLRGPVTRYQGVPTLVITGVAGIALGAYVTSRMTRVVTSRRLALLGAVFGTVLGAAAMGSLFLAVEVTGDDWPHGLSAFVTGGIFGAVVGGFLGGVIGFVHGDPRTVDRGHALRTG